jgi:hypothetical protein
LPSLAKEARLKKFGEICPREKKGKKKSKNI